MTFDELVEKLKEMHGNSEYKDKKHQGITPSLFGIYYADEIRRCGRAHSEIAQRAINLPKYGAEIGKGVNLSNYVELKSGVVL